MRSQNPALNLPQELAQKIEQVTEHQIDELILFLKNTGPAPRPFPAEIIFHYPLKNDPGWGNATN